MTWLYPSFLWALFALSIPIIIHLFNFRRYKKIIFPNVRLLQQIDHQTKSGNKLKKYLILAARLLAITFLVFAFAQPIIIDSKQSVKGGKKHISIIFDNSYSMNLQGKEGPLLEAAKNRARAIVSSANNGDEFNIITADMDASMLHFTGRQACLENIDKIKISSNAYPLQNLLALQNSQLYKFNGDKLAYCISDFQAKNSTLSSNPLDTSIKQTWVKIPSEINNNLSVDTAYLLSPILQAKQAITLMAVVSNFTEKDIENNTLELWVNGKPKGIASLSIKAFQSETVSVVFTVETGGIHQCELRLPGDNIPLDDVLYFSLRLNQDHHVNTISSDNSPYLDAVFADNPGFVYKNENAGSINYSAFKQKDLIVLQGINGIGSGLVSELSQFIQNGGTALVFPNKNLPYGGLQDLATAFRFSISEQAILGQMRVSAIDAEHPVFKNIFEKNNKQLDLPSVAKCYQIQSGSSNDFMKLANGSAFIKDIGFGKGHLLLCAVALDAGFSNFQNHALFVPICLRASMMNAYKNPLYYSCADLNDIYTGLPFVQESGVLLLGKKTSLIPEVINRDGSLYLNTNGEISIPGHYQLRLKNTDSSVADLSFNNVRTESDTRSLSSEAFDKICENFNINHFEGSAEKLGAEINKIEKGFPLWKWCILFSLICLLFEILLIRFFRNNVKLSA
jgi:hypothetical protein